MSQCIVKEIELPTWIQTRSCKSLKHSVTTFWPFSFLCATSGSSNNTLSLFTFRAHFFPLQFGLLNLSIFKKIKLRFGSFDHTNSEFYSVSVKLKGEGTFKSFAPSQPKHKSLLMLVTPMNEMHQALMLQPLNYFSRSSSFVCGLNRWNHGSTRKGINLP